MWLAIQLPDGMLGVWHWELANGARIYTDGCFAPADGGDPIPVVDFHHELQWVDGDGERRQLRARRRRRSPASPATSSSRSRAGGRSASTPTAGGPSATAPLGGGLNQVEVVTDDGRRGTGIYELTGAHHHRYFPIPRAERLPARTELAPSECWTSGVPAAGTRVQANTRWVRSMPTPPRRRRTGSS